MIARALFLLLSCALFNPPAQAHRFAPSLLRLFEIADGEYQTVWKTPAQTISPTPLRPEFPPQCSIASETPAAREGTGIIRTWILHCDGGIVGGVVAVSGLPENQASVLFSLETRQGHFHQAVLTPEQSRYRIPPAPAAAQVMAEYSILGAEHIWAGIDHLLFVFGLLLLVGWGRNLVWTITSFTLGHSLTLSLVTLGFIDYPVALVEFAIALSIFILAVELARFYPDAATAPPGLFRRHPWSLAGGFGLLHGMGFAGALAEVGLPPAEVPLALLFFNIGIEFGQLAFIAAAMAAWRIIKPVRAARANALRPIPVYALGSLSALWCIERAVEVF